MCCSVGKDQARWGQRWARYFFAVPVIPVVVTLLKVPSVPVLGT